MSTELGTIHAITRHTFPTFTRMMFVIFRVESSVTFVTVIRANQKHQSNFINEIFLDAEGPLKIIVRFIDRQHLNLVLGTRVSLKLFQFAHFTWTFLHTCQTVQLTRLSFLHWSTLAHIIIHPFSIDIVVFVYCGFHAHNKVHLCFRCVGHS